MAAIVPVLNGGGAARLKTPSGCGLASISRTLEGAPRAPPVSTKAVNASEEFLGQRDDDARRASHVAESVLVLVLDHLADEFGAVGTQASDSVVDAFDYKHDAPEAQRVRRCNRRFNLDQLWIAKLREL